MRVALDVTATITGSTGVARYATQLNRTLRESGIDTAPFTIGRGTHAGMPDARRIRVPLRVMQRSWSAFGWPAPERFVGGADLVHALDLVPPASGVPVVVTVHDLTALDHPEFHPPRRRAQQQAQFDTLDRAAVILTNSRDTARRLVDRGVQESRVAVTQFGVTPLPAPRPVDVPTPYLLLVGEITRRKGFDVFLRAFARSAAVEDVHVVFAGPDGFDASFCRPLAHELGLGGRAVFLGRVDDAELAALYRGALALCFPSIAEGFGLPVLEALAHGVPVVASSLDAVREVTADAALTVLPGNVDAWTDALERILGDDDLRRRLAAAGPPRAATFTWERTAAETIAAYERALATVA